MWKLSFLVGLYDTQGVQSKPKPQSQMHIWTYTMAIICMVHKYALKQPHIILPTPYQSPHCMTCNQATTTSREAANAECSAVAPARQLTCWDYQMARLYQKACPISLHKLLSKSPWYEQVLFMPSFHGHHCRKHRQQCAVCCCCSNSRQAWIAWELGAERSRGVAKQLVVEISEDGPMP